MMSNGENEGTTVTEQPEKKKKEKIMWNIKGLHVAKKKRVMLESNSS